MQLSRVLNLAQELVRNNLLHLFCSFTNLCSIANVRKVNVSGARHPLPDFSPNFILFSISFLFKGNFS